MTKPSLRFPIPQVLMTLFACQALCAQPAQPQANLLSNPAFEEQDGAARPKRWAFGTHKGSPKALSVADAGRDGRRCVGVETEGAGHIGLWTQDVPPAPGAPGYRLAAWIKTTPGATATLSASFYSKEKKWLSANYGVVEATSVSQWRKCAGYFRIVPETASIKIALWGNYGSRGHGTVWFDDVELTVVEKMPDAPADAPPAIRYLSPNPPPTPTAADTARGYIPFARNYLDLMPPTYAPSQAEISAELAAFCSLAEYAPVSVGLYALRDLKNVRAVVSDLKTTSGATIPASAVDVRTVRYLYKRSHYSMGDRMLVPTHLEKKPLAEAPKGQSRQFWLTIHVPSDAASGDYRGSVTVEAEGAPDTTLPLKLEVLPIRLAEPKGIGFGMYDWPPRAEGDPSSEIRFRDMRAHGMTTVGLSSGLGLKFEMAGGRGRVTFDGSSGFEKALEAYKAAGFPEPLVWLMGADLKKWALQQGSLESDAFAHAYKGVVECVLAEGKRRGWPEIIIQPEDEVFGDADRFETCFRSLKLIKEIPGARTEMDGPNTNLEKAKLTYPFTDMLVLAYGPLIYNQRSYERQEWRNIVAQAHRDKKLIYYYNFDTTGWHPESMRFSNGFYIFATGADGILNWAYAGHPTTAYDDFRGKTGTTTFFYPKVVAAPFTGASAGAGMKPAATAEAVEEGGPSIGWEGVREGLDDYRYVRTLQQLIARAESSLPKPPPGSKPAGGSLQDERVQREVAAAKQTLQQLADSIDLSRLRTNMSMQGHWAAETFDDAGEPARSGSFKLPSPGPSANTTRPHAASLTG